MHLVASIHLSVFALMAEPFDLRPWYSVDRLLMVVEQLICLKLGDCNISCQYGHIKVILKCLLTSKSTYLDMAVLRHLDSKASTTIGMALKGCRAVTGWCDDWLYKCQGERTGKCQRVGIEDFQWDVVAITLLTQSQWQGIKNLGRLWLAYTELQGDFWCYNS